MFSLRDILLTTFILGMLPMVLAKPHWGILLWTWIGLMNPHKMTWGFAFAFPFAQIVGLVTIVAVLISREKKKLPLSGPVWALFLLLIWFTVTTGLFSLYPDLAWPKWQKVMKIHFFILLTLMVMQSESRIRALVLVSTMSIAFFGIKGGIYTIARGGGGQVLGPDGGFIAGNTEIALALVVTLPLMRWLQLQASKGWLKVGAGVAMLLMAISVLGSYSRGGFLALAAVTLFLVVKSRKRLLLGAMVVAAAFAFLSFMPEEWHGKIDTIQTYQEDNSAMSRLEAWRFAWNLAGDRPIGGGGFDTFQQDAFAIWLPGVRPLDPHSIWFQILGEHGFVGFGLFLLFWFLAWREGSAIIRACRKQPNLSWAGDLAAMIQTAFVGFWVGGSFLGLAYWDYPYILVIVLVLTRAEVEKALAQEHAPAAQAPPGRSDGPLAVPPSRA